MFSVTAYWLRLGADILIIVLLAVVIYWIRRIARKVRTERDAVQEELKVVKQERQIIGDLLTTVRDLLATVKGWTVVNVESDKRRSERVDDLKHSLETVVPERTANKVVEKIEDRLHGNGGSVSETDLPTIKSD